MGLGFCNDCWMITNIKLPNFKVILNNICHLPDWQRIENIYMYFILVDIEESGNFKGWYILARSRRQYTNKYQKP